MIIALTNLLFRMQPDATGGAAPAAQTGGSPGPETPPAGPMGCVTNIGFLLAMFVVMYFLLIRPQRTQQKQHAAMLKALRKGDLVRTTGGIRGEIVEIDDKEATLLIADKVKINVLRSAVSGKEGTPGPTDKPEKKT